MSLHRPLSLVAISLMAAGTTIAFGLSAYAYDASQEVAVTAEVSADAASCAAVLCPTGSLCRAGRCIPQAQNRCELLRCRYGCENGRCLRAPMTDTSSDVPLSGCSDILCNDGTIAPTCTNDSPPHPIYYIANPCLTHGGEARDTSDDASSSSRSEPVCGNDQCEQGESDQFVQQLSCMMQPDGSCISPPPTRIPGSCPQDCPMNVRNVSSRSSSSDAPSRARDFSDLSPHSRIASAAQLLRAHRILDGYADGSFKPDRPVNRAEAMKMIVLAAYGDARVSDAPTFRDVQSDAWFAPYVAVAARLGVISGNPDGNLAPARTVNTAEFLKMLAIAFDLELNQSFEYDDVPADAWFAAYAGIAAQHELFPDRTTSLQPGRLLTRGDVAYALARMVQSQE